MGLHVRMTARAHCSVSVGFQGNVALEKSKYKKPFAWIPELGWQDAMRLVEISPEAFGNLREDIEQNESKWKKVRFTRLFPVNLSTTLTFTFGTSCTLIT